MIKYDLLYQEWLEAKRSGDYTLADQIRDEFEWLHGLTITSEGNEPIEGVTTNRMKLTSWIDKFWDRSKDYYKKRGITDKTKLIQTIKDGDSYYTMHSTSRRSALEARGAVYMGIVGGSDA